MERYAFKMFLKPGMEAEYKRRHDEIWPELVDLLREMQANRQPDSSYLFPSPQRGSKDQHLRTFKQSFQKVREAAELPTIGFHDFRHLFISKCVMANVDFMTIAEWAGHQDGGVLIGKVYGHKKSTAERLRFLHPSPNAPSIGSGQAPL